MTPLQCKQGSCFWVLPRRREDAGGFSPLVPFPVEAPAESALSSAVDPELVM